MNYKKKTPLYGIPYLSKGEGIKSEVEERRAMMLENLIFAGNCAVEKAIFDEGDYDVFDNGDSTFTMIISPQVKYSIVGILNHRLFRSEKPIMFDGLSKGNFYFMYVGYQTDMDIDASKFRKVLSEIPQSNKGYLLLATLDLRGAEPVLDDYPDGKIYSKDVLAHVADTSNPHGKDLHQDRLSIYDKLDINGKEVYETVYVDGTFAGNVGYSMVMEKTPLFVNVMPMSDGYGNYWVTISNKTISVFNSGSTGGNFKLEVRVK